MSIRQESELDCEQLRQALHNINNRLNFLQQSIPAKNKNCAAELKEQLIQLKELKNNDPKDPIIPKLDLQRIQRTQALPQKKVTATFGEEPKNIIQPPQPIIPIQQKTPQRVRSCSMNISQYQQKQPNNQQIPQYHQFKVLNTHQNSVQNSYFQSLNQSNEKNQSMNQSFIQQQQFQSAQISQANLQQLQVTRFIENPQIPQQMLLQIPQQQQQQQQQPQQIQQQQAQQRNISPMTTQYPIRQSTPQKSNLKVSQMPQYVTSSPFQQPNQQLMKQEQLQSRIIQNHQIHNNGRTPYLRQQGYVRNPSANHCQYQMMQ